MIKTSKIQIAPSAATATASYALDAAKTLTKNLLLLLAFFFLFFLLFSRRLPEFEEGLAVPVSEVPQDAAVVWVSHCWGGTPARPDDQGNTKAKSIYEGLKVSTDGMCAVSSVFVCVGECVCLLRFCSKHFPGGGSNSKKGQEMTEKVSSPVEVETLVPHMRW